MHDREVIRRATAHDAAAVARLFRTVRRICLPYLPDLHTPDEELAFFAGHVFAQCEVWIAGAASPHGFCAFREGWVDHLYVDPDHHGLGLGTTLLGKAMAAHSGLRLWVFQRNAAALRFYAARGFRQVSLTDGGRNEEREPDALLEWTRGRPG